MKYFILFSLGLSFSIGLSAQNIEFQEAAPHPYIQGALMGDIEMADVDGDGDLDLFVCGRIDGWTSADSTRLYLNDGAGAFMETIDNPFSDVQFASAQFNDIDDDGDLDLMLTGLGNFSLQIAEMYTNDGAGNFEPMMDTPFIGCQDAKIDFGDADGDGDDDVLICGSSDGSLFCTLYINDGSGLYTEAEESDFSPMLPSEVKFVDVDDDADLDVLTMGVDMDEVPFLELYLNDGNAGFDILESEILPLTSSTFDAGDVDQDGDPDVLVSGQNTEFNSMTDLYLNDGNGNFSLFEGGDVFVDVFAGQIMLHDLDGDDDLDILLSGSSDGGLGGDLGIVSNVYENLGSNDYVLADSLTGSYISNNAIGDIDGDGLPDLILSGTTVGMPNFKTWIYKNITENFVGVERLDGVGLDVYPNPTNGILNIHLMDFNSPSVEFYNLTGQLVLYRKNVIDNLLKLEIGLPSGLYNLVVKDDRSVGTFKVAVVD